MKIAFRSILALVFLAMAATALQSAEELTPENYAHWRDYALPKPGEEQWRRIPWLPTFYEGVKEAQNSEKPLLLWVMNGHPLACT